MTANSARPARETATKIPRRTDHTARQRLLAQVDRLVEVMNLDARPDFDLERRLVLAIRQGIVRLSTMAGLAVSLI